MQKDYLDYLMDIGLSEKEAQVYVSLLSVDYASVAQISKTTGINRTTVYPLLESLTEKELVKDVEIKGKTYHQAESPEALHTYIEKKKLHLAEQALRLGDMVPKLKSISRAEGEKPIVKYFEGKQGVLEIFKEWSTVYDQEGADTAYMIYDKESSLAHFSQSELSKITKERTEKDIKVLSVYTAKEANDPNPLSTRLRIDSKKYPISCDIAALGDRVRIIIFGEKISSLLVKSQDLSDSIKSIVQYMHDQSK